MKYILYKADYSEESNFTVAASPAAAVPQPAQARPIHGAAGRAGWGTAAGDAAVTVAYFIYSCSLLYVNYYFVFD